MGFFNKIEKTVREKTKEAGKEILIGCKEDAKEALEKFKKEDLKKIEGQIVAEVDRVIPKLNKV